MEQNENQINPMLAFASYIALRNAMELLEAESEEEEHDILEHIGLSGTDRDTAIYGLLMIVEKEMRNDLFPALGVEVTEGGPEEDVD